MVRGKCLLYLLTTCGAFAPGLAWADTVQQSQTALPNQNAEQSDTGRGGDNGDEILVTAQRRQERVIDVPISVAVVGSEQLNRQNVSSLFDLGQVTPALDIGQQNNVGGAGSIRGIGTQSANLGAVSAVGIVVDQVSQGNANIGDIFDVARIEVLKGPQGTLFGLTTSAGVVNITTNAPDPNQFTGSFRSQLSGSGIAGSGFGRQLLQGVVNVPLTGDSALRVAATGELRQGPNRNVTNNKLSNTDHYSVRARYKWTPSDQLTVNVIGDYTYAADTNNGDFLTIIGLPQNQLALLAACGVTVAPGNRDFCVAQQFRHDQNTYGASAQIDYDLGPVTLTSITSFRRLTSASDGQDIFRADPLPLQVLIKGPQPLAINLFTQELRLASAEGGKLEYTFGAFASSQITDSVGAPQLVTLQINPFFKATFVNSQAVINHTRDRSVAMFGQTTYHVTDALSLITGARLTSASLNNDQYNPNALTQNPPVNPATVQNYSTLAFSYKAGLQYQISPSSIAYATYSKGYKGAQIALPSLPLAPYIVNPELPRDFEIGYKQKLFGGMVLDVNLYYEDVRNYQTQKCVLNVVGGSASCAQSNISRVISKGAEIDIFGNVSKELSLSTGLIYQSVTYPSGFTGSDGSDLSGQQLAMAPKWKATFSGSYDVPINDNSFAFGTLNVVYKSSVRYGADNFEDDVFHAHAIVGGQIGAKMLNNRFKAYLFVANLFNVHEPESLNGHFIGGVGTGAVYGPNSFRHVGIGLEAGF